MKTGSRWLAVVAVALVAVLAVSACGKSKKKSAAGNTLSVTITESGKTAKYAMPPTVKGGLTTLRVTNNGKAPHQAQLAKIDGHTPQELFKIVAANNPKIPDWLRAEGGIGATPPGKTDEASLNLDPGNYIVFDPPSGPGSGSGPPGYLKFTVTAGSSGSLPSTPSTVTANEVGKDKYRWDVSGSALKTGLQDVTFVSKGKTALHLLGAFRVTGNPSKAEILKALKSNGKPPAFVDQSSFYSGAVLDGGKSQTQQLTLGKPGTWVLFCPISDRDGGKPHFEEGLLKTVTVK